MLISTNIISINSASTVAGRSAVIVVIITVSIIISVIINSTGIVTRKTIRTIMIIMKVTAFPVVFTRAAAFKGNRAKAAETDAVKFREASGLVLIYYRYTVAPQVEDIPSA